MQKLTDLMWITLFTVLFSSPSTSRAESATSEETQNEEAAREPASAKPATQGFWSTRKPVKKKSNVNPESIKSPHLDGRQFQYAKMPESKRSAFIEDENNPQNTPKFRTPSYHEPMTPKEAICKKLSLDPRTATPAQIKKAYKLKALEIHPDKNPEKRAEAEEEMKQLVDLHGRYEDQAKKEKLEEKENKAK